MATANEEAIDSVHLREAVVLDGVSGRLAWRHRPRSHFKSSAAANRWNGRFPGRRAFCSVSDEGYLVGKFDSVDLKSHRVVWFLVHGKWPADQIDHIDGDRSNNAPRNLRSVTNVENSRNVVMPKSNTSGFVGVSATKHGWVAYINIEANQRTHLGTFHRKEDAVRARRQAALSAGYTERHGESA